MKQMEEEYEPAMSRRVKKFSEPPILPDLIQIITPESSDRGVTSPGPASPDPAQLATSLQLRLGHIQHVRRLSRRERRLAPPPPPPPPPVVPSRRASAPARPSALAARLRKISVADTLRQVGRDLRRIADHFQITRLVVGAAGGQGRDLPKI